MKRIEDNTFSGYKINHSPAQQTAKRILSQVMKFRRLPAKQSDCLNENCERCSSEHLQKIVDAVEKGEPAVFALPSFPGKSPNPQKVLGPLPDLAEKLSLQFLGSLCERVEKFYSPGIKIILCSDGRVFSDVVGMAERDVSAYQDHLALLIQELSLEKIETYNLDEIYRGASYDRMRGDLMRNYGNPVETLKEKIRAGAKSGACESDKEAHRMYLGITRFLFEDSVFPGQTSSRSALQKDARVRAYELIRRSNAWSELIKERFPGAVRLSIHPQTCGSKKLGIRLIGNESWMTPWHGVAVETSSGFSLLKRSDAESLGAELVMSPDGRPSHFKLSTGAGYEA